VQQQELGYERHGSGQAGVAVFTFGSFVNPNRAAPSYAFMKTCLDLRKTRGGDFDAYYFLARANDWYLSGIHGLGSDVQEAETALRSLRQRHPGTIFIGNSMGGHAAIRFGIRCGADLIVAFSPQVRLDRSFREAQGDRRWNDAITLLQRDYGADELTLETALEGGPSRAQVHVYVGADCAQDVAQAECLRRFPSVVIHAIEGADHDLVHALRENGRLKTILGDAVSALTPPRHTRLQGR
jgi:hypothetical protein